MLNLFSPLLLAIAAPADITGVYEVAGVPADVYIVLHERADGELLGYIAGSPTVWIESGQTYGSGALIELQGTDTDFEEPWSATLRVRLSGRHLEGILLQEGAALPITLERTSLRFVDESWIWYDFANATMHDVSRVLDPGNNFLGGGFNSSDSCMFMACGGVIEDWVETGTTHDITTSSTGDCGQTANLSGTFDASANQLDGTWSSVDCTGTPSSGAFLGGKWGGVYDKDVSAMLLSLGSFADDVEDESLDAADVFHSSYLSDGFTRADWEARLAAWYSSYEDLQVEISGPRQLLTVIGSDVHPYLLGEPRVAWEVTITGTHSSTGAEEVLYERSEPDFTGPGLNLIGVESGRIVFTGNGESQPLSIGLPIQLSDVSTDHYVAWPFGVHGGGHAEDGHPGIDFCYIAGAKVIAAEAGEITAITVNTGWTPTQWDITQTIRPGVQLRYGHIADPPAVNVGDVLAAGDIIGDPSNTSDGNRMIHFALSLGSASADDDTCPTPWFNAAAAADWDVIWSLSHYSEELAEPLACNNREADPPYVATWHLETAGATASPGEILFFREDGYEHNYVYTFFDASGSAYETGVTEWMTSPTTLGLKFIADCTGNLTFAAVDVIGDEMQIKLDTMGMPTDMSGAAVYRYGEPADPPGYTKLYVSLMNASSVRVIDLSTGLVGAPISVGVSPAHLAYSPTSNEVFVGDLFVNEIHRISTETEELSAPVSISEPSGCVDINPETDMVYAVETGSDGMHIYDASSGGWPKEVLLGTDLQDLRVDATHDMVYASDFVDGIHAFDAASNTWATYAMSGGPHGLAVDSSASLLYVTLVGDDAIKVLSTSSRTSLPLLTTINSTSAIAFFDPQWIALNADKTKAYVTNEGSDELIVLDTSDPDPANFTIMGQIDVGDGPFFITVDTESHRAYVTNVLDDSISVIDTTTDTVVRTICLSPGDMPVGLTLAH